MRSHFESESGGDAGCLRRPYGTSVLSTRRPDPKDARPRLARARGRHRQARISAANAGDNGAIQWPT